MGAISYVQSYRPFFRSLLNFSSNLWGVRLSLPPSRCSRSLHFPEYANFQILFPGRAGYNFPRRREKNNSGFSDRRICNFCCRDSAEKRWENQRYHPEQKVEEIELICR